MGDLFPISKTESLKHIFQAREMVVTMSTMGIQMAMPPFITFIFHGSASTAGYVLLKLSSIFLSYLEDRGQARYKPSFDMIIFVNVKLCAAVDQHFY